MGECPPNPKPQCHKKHKKHKTNRFIRVPDSVHAQYTTSGNPRWDLLVEQVGDVLGLLELRSLLELLLELLRVLLLRRADLLELLRLRAVDGPTSCGFKGLLGFRLCFVG